MKAPQELGTTRQTSRRKRPYRIENILVPTDFSPASQRVLEIADDLARQFGGQIVVVTVMEPLPEAGSGRLSAVLSAGRDLKETEQSLESFAQKSVSHEVLKCTKVLAGRAYEEIIKASRKLKSDLIIMATHGYSGAATSSEVVGSTTERVVRYAQCPVLTIRPELRSR